MTTELRWLDSASSRRQPMRAGQPSTVKHPDATTVVLRSGTGSRQLSAGQHRTEDSGTWRRDRDYQARHGFGDHRRGSDWARSGRAGWSQHRR